VSWGYGIAVVLVLATLLLSHWPAFHLESAPVSLFLCAVVFSAWFGGVGPGLLAAMLSALAFYYSFLPPVDSWAAKPSEMPRFTIFVVSEMLVGLLSVAQSRATESLRLARDVLNETVQELKRTNESLGKSEAYLAQAQTLSHTGSFGWNASSGELFWSEETFRIFGYDRAINPTVPLALERVHPDDLRLVQEALDGAMLGRDMDLEHRLVMLDGSIKIVHVLGHVLNRHSEKLDFVGAVMDITTVKNAFEEIQILRDQLYKETLALREEIDITRMFEEIVGSSPALQVVLSGVARVAPSDYRRKCRAIG
jgi:PAS domain-containing protein